MSKFLGARDNSGPMTIMNPPISVAAPKPLSSYMDSRFVLPTKTPSFASSNFYPPMSLKDLSPFGGGIKSKAVTSSLPVEGSLLKVGSFSFCSPVIASAAIKPIFSIKATGYKNKIYTPICYVSGGNFLSFGYMSSSASSNRSGGEFTDYSSTSGSGGFDFRSSIWGGGFLFETYPKIKTEHVSGAVSGDIPCPYKVNTVKKNVIEDVEYDVD